MTALEEFKEASNYSKRRIAMNPEVSEEIIEEIIVEDNLSWLQDELAKNPKTSRDQLRRIYEYQKQSKNKDTIAIQEISRNEKTPPEILVDIAKMGTEKDNQLVIAALLDNKKIPLQVLSILWDYIRKGKEEYLSTKLYSNPNTPPHLKAVIKTLGDQGKLTPNYYE
jgi:hypothetical protein